MRKKDQKHAQKLRRKGLSIGDISKKMGISKSSISAWVKNVQLTETQKGRLQARNAINNHKEGAAARSFLCRERRKQYQKEGIKKSKENNPLHIMGCMLYWAEGAKDQSSMTFSNSDPDMVCLFVKFLRESYKVQKNKIIFRIYCHSEDTQEIHRIELFWQTLLKLSAKNMRKTIVNNVSKYSKRKRKKNKLPYGVCRVSVNDVSLLQNIYGSIQGCAKIRSLRWLDIKK